MKVKACAPNSSSYREGIQVKRLKFHISNNNNDFMFDENGKQLLPPEKR